MERKIWDLFLFYGEVAFFKTALGIFDLIQSELIEMAFDDC
jgi:hypothetical protein